MNLPSIAVFDFDHTLTNRDSLLPFLMRTVGKAKAIGYLFLLIPTFVLFLLGILSRQKTKEKILSLFLKDYSYSEILILGKRYAEQQLNEYLKPEAMERLAWHQARNDRCILVSASLEFYLEPWGQKHGFEKVLSSCLKVDSSGQVTGLLKGLNCWGPEKKRVLLNYLGPRTNYQLYVYGDSRGDKELLELADYPFYRTFK